MPGSPDHPFLGYGRQLGGPATVACHDCEWAQAVNEHLHEGREDLLLAWHIAHLEPEFDHLSGPGPGMRLQIPGYIRCSGNGSGGLAIADERTRGGHGAYNHECLAIFKSVAGGGGVSAAEMMGAQRLGISRSKARREILHVTTSLYRAGLLQPARTGEPESAS
jgi:hypothetical protein